MAMRAQRPGVSLLSPFPSDTLSFQFLEQPLDKTQNPETEKSQFPGVLFWTVLLVSPVQGIGEETLPRCCPSVPCSSKSWEFLLGGSFCSPSCVVGCQRPAPSTVGGYLDEWVFHEGAEAQPFGRMPGHYSGA